MSTVHMQGPFAARHTRVLRHCVVTVALATLSSALPLQVLIGQEGAPAAYTGTRTTPDEVHAIKGWAGAVTDGGNKTFSTDFSWVIAAQPSGAFLYTYNFLKTRGPRIGTFGLELPAWCAGDALSACIDLASVQAYIVEVPGASFTTTTSWFDFVNAQADLVPLTMNAFAGARFDFTDFTSGNEDGGGAGGGAGGGQAALTWQLSFLSPLAPVWGSFFASPLLSDEEEGGGSGGNGQGGGEDEGEVLAGCPVNYGLPEGTTEIPGPPRAYNCGGFYEGLLENGGWVATPSDVVPEPITSTLLATGLLGLGLLGRRRHREA